MTMRKKIFSLKSDGGWEREWKLVTHLPFNKTGLTCDVIAPAFIFKQALPENAEVSGRIDWNITEFVLIARNPKYSVQKGSKVRTSQIFSYWFCRQGDGKRGPWKSNSCLQKEGFCLRLGWIVQNQTSPVPQTFVSSGDGQVLFTLDLSFCCCAVAGSKVTAKHLFDTCVSSVWRWTWGSLILCLITKCPGQAFTFCGSQATAVLCRHRQQRPPSRCGWCPAGWTQKPNP